MTKENLNKLQAELMAELEMAEKQEKTKELTKSLSLESSKTSGLKQSMSQARKEAKQHSSDNLTNIESSLKPSSKKVAEQYAQSDELKAKVAAIKSSSFNLKLSNEQKTQTYNLEIRKPSRAAMHLETMAANKGKTSEELNAITDERIQLLEEGLERGMELVNAIDDQELKNKVIKGLNGSLSSLSVKNLSMSAIRNGDSQLSSISRRIDNAIGEKFEPNAGANYEE